MENRCRTQVTGCQRSVNRDRKADPQLERLRQNLIGNVIKSSGDRTFEIRVSVRKNRLLMFQ